MKMEVEYTIEEITKYRIVRTYTVDGPTWSTGADFGAHRGEFETRDAAEKVKAALEAVLGDTLKNSIG